MPLIKQKIKSKGEPFGLDVGDSGIRLAQIHQNSQGLKLVRFHAKDFPVQQDPLDSVSMINILKELLRDSGINSSRANVNLYGANPAIKFLSLPSMSDEELKKAIKWEASKFIVYDLDKMIIDYAVLNETEEDNKKKFNMVVVATAKDTIINELNMLKEAGIEPISIGVDTLAQFHAAKASGNFEDKENIVFIEIAARKTNITVIDSGEMCFRRECLNVGSADINRALKEELSIDLVEAENIKKTFFLDVKEPAEPKGKVIHNAIKSVLERAIMEIKRSLDYYMDNFPQNTIDKAVIAGGGACMKNIDAFLANSLGIPVEIIDPLKKISVAEEMSGAVNIKYNAPSLSTVIGLALESIQ